MTALLNKPKKGILKARCEMDLEDFYNQLARLRRLEISDLVREALYEYAERTSKDAKFRGFKSDLVREAKINRYYAERTRKNVCRVLTPS